MESSPRLLERGQSPSYRSLNCSEFGGSSCFGHSRSRHVTERLWNNAELLSARQAEHTKVASVQSENGFNPLSICQMYQRCIGELYPQALILSENRADSGKVCLVQRKKLKRSTLER